MNQSLPKSVLMCGFHQTEWPDFIETAQFTDLIESIWINESLKIIVYNSALQNDVSTWLAKIEWQKEKFQSLQSCLWIVLDSDKFTTENLKLFLQNFKLFHFIDTNNQNIKLNNILLKTIEEALFTMREFEQNQILEKLVTEKQVELKNENLKLDKKISLQKNQLQNLKSKLKIVNEWGFLLRQALWIIHRSESLVEIQNLLFELLHNIFGLCKIEIQMPALHLTNLSQSTSSINNESSFLQFSLHSDNAIIAHFLLEKEKNKPFSPEEKDFFYPLVEALELSISRMKANDDLLELETQWQQSFDAILDPVVLISENYEIIQTNKSAAQLIEKNKHPFENLCYKALFQLVSPCENCQMNQKFEINNQHHNYEVSSHHIQRFNSNSAQSRTFIHLYKDVTAYKQLEKVVIEQSTKAEIGTLSGSIAHELNNPIGGILTLAQILKMDFKPTTKEYDLFSLIEKKSIECKEIIENLLEFTHAQVNEQNINSSLIDILKSSLVSISPFHKSLEDHFIITHSESTIFLNSKPKLLAEIFYLLFVALMKIYPSQWNLDIQQNHDLIIINIKPMPNSNSQIKDRLLTQSLKPSTENFIDLKQNLEIKELANSTVMRHLKSLNFEIEITESSIVLNFKINDNKSNA